MLKVIQEYGHLVLGSFVSLVFIQSLYFKFLGSPETKYIFEEKLNTWAETFGFQGLFAPRGLFSASHIGSVELLASLLIVTGMIFGKGLVQGAGAVLGLGIMSGAIFFHLFTPLGISVKNADGNFDGGQLFFLAVGVWVSCLILVYLRREDLLHFILRK